MVVERTSLKKIDFVQPVHQSKSYEGNRKTQGGGVEEKECYVYFVEVVDVSICYGKLGVCELFIQFILELVDG